MDSGRAWLKLLRQILNAATGAVKRHDLLPESRRVRVPRSRHADTFRSKPCGVHETGGTPADGYRIVKYERERGRIEVYADRDGRRWELKIDPRDGRIVEVEAEHD